MATESIEGRPGLCDFERLTQFWALPEETLARMQSMCRPRSYTSGQTIVFPEDEPQFVGFVTEGFLRMQKTLADGREHIVGLLVEGDMFGRVFNGPANFGIEAATDAELLTFPRAAFEQLLLSSADLERLVLLNMLNELDRARDWMIILTNQKITCRLAGFFLVLCTRFNRIDHLVRVEPSYAEVKIPIGRADVARLLGTRPESISRAFHELADDGIISIERPDLIRILDAGALIEAAGDDSLAQAPSLKNLVQVMRSEGRTSSG